MCRGKSSGPARDEASGAIQFARRGSCLAVCFGVEQASLGLTVVLKSCEL